MGGYDGGEGDAGGGAIEGFIAALTVALVALAVGTIMYFRYNKGDSKPPKKDEDSIEEHVEIKKPITAAEEETESDPLMDTECKDIPNNGAANPTSTSSVIIEAVDDLTPNKPLSTPQQPDKTWGKVP